MNCGDRFDEGAQAQAACDTDKAPSMIKLGAALELGEEVVE